jgi:hypothetical protein
LCEFEVSTTQVSRAAAELEELLTQWQKRPLGEISFLYVDARYEKVREATLCARLASAALWATKNQSPTDSGCLRPVMGLTLVAGSGFEPLTSGL